MNYEALTKEFFSNGQRNDITYLEDDITLYPYVRIATIEHNLVGVDLRIVNKTIPDAIKLLAYKYVKQNRSHINKHEHVIFYLKLYDPDPVSTLTTPPRDAIINPNVVNSLARSSIHKD